MCTPAGNFLMSEDAFGGLKRNRFQPLFQNSRGIALRIGIVLRRDVLSVALKELVSEPESAAESPKAEEMGAFSLPY